jgi:hypothetical protein
MIEIFISYRREDSQAHAGRLYDLLVSVFDADRIFMDVDGISPGEGFVNVIGDRLASCAVFLAVIGPRWARVRKRLRRRIFQANDFVRLETMVALNRPIKVIPVLVGGATIPAAETLPGSIAEIAGRHAKSISHARFREDAKELAEITRRALATAVPLTEAQVQVERVRVGQLITADLEGRRLRARRRLVAAAWVVASLFAAGTGIWGLQHFLAANQTGSANTGTALPGDRGRHAPGPSFGRKDPDPKHFTIPHPSDTSAYLRLAQSTRNLEPGPVPPARGGVEPILRLADVFGPSGQGVTSAIVNAGRIVFHAAGSTGNVRSPEHPNQVATAMENDFGPNGSKPPPSFLLDLGDVIYSFGEAKYYYDQLYLPYRQYPAPIFAVAGNHDGMVAPGTDATPLQAFLKNFCAEGFQNATDETAGRTPQIQPGVYFTLEAPFVRILALYSNTLNDQGVISDRSGVQLRFLEEALKRVKRDHFRGAVIIAVHHDCYSMAPPRGSPHLQADLDSVAVKTGVWPHAVLSGHSHKYQRYTRTIGGIEIPYIVAGDGGYGHVRGPGLRTPFEVSPGPLILQSYNDQDFGFLRVTVDRERLRVEHQQVTDGGTAGSPVDSVTVELATHRVVAGSPGGTAKPSTSDQATRGTPTEPSPHPPSLAAATPAATRRSTSMPSKPTGIATHAADPQPTYLGAIDADILCKQMYGDSHSGSLTSAGVTCAGAAGEHQVPAATACSWLYGSGRFARDPGTLSLVCDISIRTLAPCSNGQRRCGANLEYCCPKMSSPSREVVQ